jgi:hypothetical protein
VSGVVACTVTENLSAMQSVQAADCASDQVPVMHGMHVEGSEAPMAGEAVPAGHGTQVCAPVTLFFWEKVPAWHCCAVSWVSTVLPTLTIPVAPWFAASWLRVERSMMGLSAVGRMDQLTWI